MGRSDGRAVPVSASVKDVHIQLHWTDYGKGSKTFANVHELAQFLKDNPLLAQAVDYVARPPKPNQLKMPDFFMGIPPPDQATWIWCALDIIKRKGSVEMNGRIFTNDFQFQQYVEKLMHAR